MSIQKDFSEEASPHVGHMALAKKVDEYFREKNDLTAGKSLIHDLRDHADRTTAQVWVQQESEGVWNIFYTGSHSDVSATFPAKSLTVVRSDVDSGLTYAVFQGVDEGNTHNIKTITTNMEAHGITWRTHLHPLERVGDTKAVEGLLRSVTGKVFEKLEEYEEMKDMREQGKRIASNSSFDKMRQYYYEHRGIRDISETDYANQLNALADVLGIQEGDELTVTGAVVARKGSFINIGTAWNMGRGLELWEIGHIEVRQGKRIVVSIPEASGTVPDEQFKDTMISSSREQLRSEGRVKVHQPFSDMEGTSRELEAREVIEAAILRLQWAVVRKVLDQYTKEHDIRYGTTEYQAAEIDVVASLANDHVEAMNGFRFEIQAQRDRGRLDELLSHTHFQKRTWIQQLLSGDQSVVATLGNAAIQSKPSGRGERFTMRVGKQKALNLSEKGL